MTNQPEDMIIASIYVHSTIASVLHSHGPLAGEDTESDHWDDCSRGEIHGDVAKRIIERLEEAGYLIEFKGRRNADDH